MLKCKVAESTKNCSVNIFSEFKFKYKMEIKFFVKKKLEKKLMVGAKLFFFCCQIGNEYVSLLAKGSLTE